MQRPLKKTRKRSPFERVTRQIRSRLVTSFPAAFSYIGTKTFRLLLYLDRDALF